MQDLSEVQEAYDEGYDDSGNIDLQLLRCAAILPFDLPRLLAFVCDGFEEREDPEDDWWLRWTLKIQDKGFLGQRSLQIGD